MATSASELRIPGGQVSGLSLESQNPEVKKWVKPGQPACQKKQNGLTSFSWNWLNAHTAPRCQQERPRSGSVSTICSMVTTPFAVGGGVRMVGGALGIQEHQSYCRESHRHAIQPLPACVSHFPLVHSFPSTRSLAVACQSPPLSGQNPQWEHLLARALRLPDFHPASST